MYKQGKYPIVSKKTLAKGIFDIEIYCPHIAKAAKAGQFAQVQAEGFFLRRPQPWPEIKNCVPCQF